MGECVLHCAATNAYRRIRINSALQPNPNAQPNNYSIATGSPTFVRSVPNGKLYRAGAPGFDFNVAHLWGTPYELGFAHGQLFSDVAQNVSLAVWQYMQQQVLDNLTFLPTWLADLVAQYGLEAALDLIAALTAPSTPAHFLQELQGLADATGVCNVCHSVHASALTVQCVCVDRFVGLRVCRR